MDPEPLLRRRNVAGAAEPAPVWGSALATLILFAAIGFEASGRNSIAGTEAHHDRVRITAQSTIPYSVGDWLGRDVESARAAVALLRPNVLVNRAYRNLRTGETASLLFVQCSDARDLIGHYPPVCYPAHGRVLLAQASRDWVVGGSTIQGTRYRFGGSGAGASSETVVDNFMVLPTGRFGRDMDAVGDVAGDVRMRRFGAAEVQIVTDGAMSDERRDEVLRALVEPTVPLLRTVSSETRE